MNQLTNEEIAKVFAIYLNDTAKVNTKDGIMHLVAVDIFNQTVDVCESYDSVDPNYENLQDVKLLLKPLSSISDEDAVEVGKLAARRPDHYTKEDADITRHKNSIDVVFTDKIDEVINISFDGDILLYSWISATKKVIEERVNCQVHIVDYLREKGYALPYKGQSLFELGIAIENK